MNNIVAIIRDPAFHAVNFHYAGQHYTFSGWWMLEWDDGDKIYNSKEDFINDPFFDGRTIGEIQSETTDVDFEFEP